MDRKTVFTFPGQNSFSSEVFSALLDSSEQSQLDFERAAALVKSCLNESLSPLVGASVSKSNDIQMNNPEIDQFGIFLIEYWLAQDLIAKGVKPGLLIGHSFGEFAALAISGLLSFDTTIKIICHRIKSIREYGQPGVMAAVSCGQKKAQELIAQMSTNFPEIAVVNYSKQTIISGNDSSITALEPYCLKQGISVTRLNSRHPYHSQLLQKCVEPFYAAITHFAIQENKYPIYLGTEQTLYDGCINLHQSIAHQLSRPLNFLNALQLAYRHGYMHFIECGAGDIVTKITKKALPQDLKLKIENTEPVNFITPEQDKRVTHTVDKQAAQGCPEMPIAIVGMGCILPAAKSPKEYWQNILDGVNGVVDMVATDLSAVSSFLGGELTKDSVNIVPDKSYTFLTGYIKEPPYDEELLGNYYSKQEFNGLVKGQQLLAIALAQSVANVKGINDAVTSETLQCILGSTADGTVEYDETLLVDGYHETISTLDASDDLKASLSQDLQNAIGHKRGRHKTMKQHNICHQVVEHMLGKGIKTYLIDSACSSSLYSINLGMKALRNGDLDLVLCGGQFASGPANNTLFAQFAGLTPTASRPLSEEANGVVFSDGAGVFALKRLDSALEDGDEIHAVIRAMGLSSDGKSPSANVPQEAGQTLAINRALSSGEISADSIQYIEMHATATPVGDTVEYSAMSNAMKIRDKSLPPIEIASVKSLIGHTGWTSGIASAIKLCMAFKSKTIPPQHHCEQPRKEFALEDSPFQINRKSCFWQDNTQELPRRAGINGFGFGGTNAHMIMEEFQKDYHANLCKQFKRSSSKTSPLTIVASANLFPTKKSLQRDTPLFAESPDFAYFNREKLHLPPKKLVLPDVADQMDSSQYLSVLAAHEIFSSLPTRWQEVKDRIGVVIGVEGKTERGVGVSYRIYLDWVQQKLIEHTDFSKNRAKQELFKKMVDKVKQQQGISGPYTLPGLMPNLASGRVTNMYDLKGPNMVVDMGKNSLFQSIQVAEQLLLHNDCDIVLVGAINSASYNVSGEAEAAVMVAICTEKIAEQLDFPKICSLDINIADEASHSDYEAATSENKVSFRGVSGAIELHKSLQPFLNATTDSELPDPVSILEVCS